MGGFLLHSPDCCATISPEIKTHFLEGRPMLGLSPCLPTVARRAVLPAGADPALPWWTRGVWLLAICSLAFAAREPMTRGADIPPPAPLLIVNGHTGEVTTAIFSRDGRRLVSAAPKEVKVWDASNGRELLNLAGHTD